MFRAILVVACGAVLGGCRGVEPAVEQDLTAVAERAGENRGEILRALHEAPQGQKEGMRWLVERMPERDLQELDAEFLLTNCAEAYAAWEGSAWRSSVSEEVFLDAVLPYASVNEKREDWRTGFRRRFGPMVAHARTTSEAAVILNKAIFAELKVKYSTKRQKADQSPSESMESGLASCTGLSILLIDACRAVGVPARFVGTPLWSDRSGNHSWVEIWDNGWHFTGAAEPTGDTLNGGWFVDRAATAKRDDPEMAVYATTWKESPITFPMVWSPEDRSVRAVNVTDRYTSRGEKIEEGKARVRFRVKGAGGRVGRKVTVKGPDGEVVFEGVSKDERFDSNDHLTAVLGVGEKCRAECEGCGDVEFTVADGEVVDLMAER